MRTVEFEAEITNGMIEIPAEFRDCIGNSVRVTLSSEKRVIGNSKSILHQWIASPIRIWDFKPLSREQIHAR